MEEVIAHSQISRSKGFISHESSEPGYIAVSFIVFVPNPASGTRSISLRSCPSLLPPAWHLPSHIHDSWRPLWGRPKRCLEC